MSDESPYSTLGYATSCDHLGAPLPLPRAGATLLVRPVADGSPARDAVAPYPLLACRDWQALPADLDAITDVVTVAAVIDPLADTDRDTLRRAFPDVLRRYKVHHCAHVDPASPLRHVAARHRRKAAAARQRLRVEIHHAPHPAGIATAWCRLYAALGERHDLSAPSRFSAASLAAQLDLPGAFIAVAHDGSEVVAAAVWFVGGATCHYHLGASSAVGYQHGASFGVFAAAMEHAAVLGVELIDFGGAADGSADDGLARFKRGWSDHTRDAFLGGRIVDRAAYAELTAGRSADAGFFPPYRAPSRSNHRE